MSQDPANGKLFDPQSLNKYSYARNNPVFYVDPDGRETTVYIEKGNWSYGIKSAFGHTFVSISREDKTTTYSWAPNDGRDHGQATPDLYVTNTDYIANKEGNVYTTYTFDTTPEQEKAIKQYYDDLAKKNDNAQGDSRQYFEDFSYNCTDVSVEALKKGDVVSQDFSAKTSNVSTPYGLKLKLDEKYFKQKIGQYVPTVNDKKIMNLKKDTVDTRNKDKVDSKNSNKSTNKNNKR
ncbi:MAG: hypothetical protein MUF50_01645 [Planctomycetes bacterium]|jgi:hypothetical protein|nr:hypothetical protein [Planctomycetota bacterium]